MAVIMIQGQDAIPITADLPPDLVPAPKPKIGGRAADANDGGWLWWDHDDPGEAGASGEIGEDGVPGNDGNPGGNTPVGIPVIIHESIDGGLNVFVSGGRGQDGGHGGRGGNGGDGQDGGNSDDEQPAGAGGRGGQGGRGGRGGNGGKGGDIYEVDIIVGSKVDVSQVLVQYTNGQGGNYGPGGEGGLGGNPGNGSGGTHGDPGPVGFVGTIGPQGFVTPAKVLND